MKVKSAKPLAADRFVYTPNECPDLLRIGISDRIGQTDRIAADFDQPRAQANHLICRHYPLIGAAKRRGNSRLEERPRRVRQLTQPGHYLVHFFEHLGVRAPNVLEAMSLRCGK